jgi:Na+-translocating ferredoxin:NAD+ oxidoreductase RnfD subunit
MNGKVEAILAGSAALGATAVAALPDSETMEAVGRWPLVVVLGAVCCFCVWIIYLQGCQFGKRLDKLSDAIRHLAENIKDRPHPTKKGSVNDE